MLTKEEYEAKRQARYERLLAAAERASRESKALLDTAHSMADVIPFGQPILVGHYSEGRDRRYRARIENKFRKGFELYERAQELKSRAEHTSDAIMSDDPTACDQLAQKIASLEAEQATMKAVNAAHARYLKDPASLDKSDLSDGYKKIIREYTPAYSWEPHPFAPFQLTNNSANIRRLKERTQVVAKRQAAEDREVTVGDKRVQYCPSENRIRIYFPGKPDEATRTALKRHGYRWTPTMGCWQAYYNYNAGEFVKTLTA